MIVNYTFVMNLFAYLVKLYKEVNTILIIFLAYGNFMFMSKENTNLKNLI